MTKRIALINDYTTTGGKLISGHQRVVCNGSAVALLGDKTTCPKCKSIGTIIEGAKNWIIDGKPVAYDGCIIACGCRPIGINRVIATQSHMFVDMSSNDSSIKISSLPNKANTINSTLLYQQSNSIKDEILVQQHRLIEEHNLIRIDANNLLQCVDELCDKHLYHDDIKLAFKKDVTEFANNIVYQVDNGSLSYEQAAEKIKAEEKNLIEQSVDWITNGLSILGGLGMLSVGIGLCSTGLCCLIGAPLILHGGNGLYEGVMGTSNGFANLISGGKRPLSVEGPLREIYKDSAKVLGFNASVGTLIYDLVDFGISVKGKLKLVPKLNDFGNPTRKLWYFGRKDLERAYLQMKRKLLYLEMIQDSFSIMTVYEDLKHSFILDKDTKQVSMVISEPEKIINAEEIIDNCSLVITITGNKDDDMPDYFLCERVDGSKYQKDYSGNITEGGIR